MRTPAQTRVLQRLMDEARRLDLLSSPPYSTAREKTCWETGYETALADIAGEKLTALGQERRDG